MTKKKQATNRRILVLDPNYDPRWQADFITHDINKFDKAVFSNQSCEIIIDESGEMVGKYAGDMMRLATRSRHFGHCLTLISQRAQMIDKNMRDQCSTLYCFSQNFDDAKLLARSFNDDKLSNANTLRAGEFYCKKRFKKIVKLNVFDLTTPST